jgi:hypothetical protein
MGLTRVKFNLEGRLNPLSFTLYFLPFHVTRNSKNLTPSTRHLTPTLYSLTFRRISSSAACDAQ